MKRSPNWDPTPAAIAPTSPSRTTASGCSRILPRTSASWTSSLPMPESAAARRRARPTKPSSRMWFAPTSTVLSLPSIQPLLYMNDNGSIIFNGSVQSYLGQPGVAAYAATKGGLVSMARSIAADLAPRKIRVNVVAPGATKTPIWKRGPRANATQKESAKLSDFFSSTIPLGRWGEPEDLARAVLFLASDDSSYINAVELVVDGGLTGAPFGAAILRA